MRAKERPPKVTSASSRKIFTWNPAPSNFGSNSMNRLSIIREFFEFLRERKKWWIAPILIFLILLGGLLIFASSSALAPFIYSLF